MTNEQKDLLFKDLCARLPYNVKCLYRNAEDEIKVGKLNIIQYDEERIVIDATSLDHKGSDVVGVFPYLFPLSSMTEEQANELFDLFGISLLDLIGGDYIKINECTGITFFLNKGFDVETHLDKLMNWLNSNHFDYRGLISMGLAIDATNLNIY